MVLPFAWALIIAVLSLVPSPPTTDLGLLGWDKFQHAAAYGVLCLLVGRFLGGIGRCRRTMWPWAVAVTILFGALLEVAQGTLATGRSAELSDLAADGAGAVVAALGARCCRRWRRGTCP